MMSANTTKGESLVVGLTMWLKLSQVKYAIIRMESFDSDTNLGSFGF
jgi:hypothetical protein